MSYAPLFECTRKRRNHEFLIHKLFESMWPFSCCGDFIAHKHGSLSRSLLEIISAGMIVCALKLPKNPFSFNQSWYGSSFSHLPLLPSGPGGVGRRTIAYGLAYTKGVRRERDSNPRWGCPHNGFRDRPIQPLSHLSIVSIRAQEDLNLRPLDPQSNALSI